jgi:hypothetical protein
VGYRCGAVDVPSRHALRSKDHLHTPLADPAKLNSFVEACIADSIVLIAVLGPDDKVEGLIDEIVVGDGSDENRFVITSSHRDCSLEKSWILSRITLQGPVLKSTR